jgi:hypothetical protein
MSKEHIEAFKELFDVEVSEEVGVVDRYILGRLFL